MIDAALEEYLEVDQEIKYMVLWEDFREGLAEEIVSDLILKAE